MKKIIILVILILLVIHSSGVVLAESNLNQKLNLVVTKLLDNVVDEGTIVKLKKDKLYLNLGRVKGVSQGQLYNVIRQEEVLTDPTNKLVLGRIKLKIAEIEISKVDNNYASAKINKLFTKLEPKVGDKVVIKNNANKVGVMKLNANNIPIEFANMIRDKISSSLVADNRVQLVTIDNSLYDQYFNKTKYNNQQLGLIADKLDLQLLITGEIYKGSKNIFIAINLFDNRLKNTIAEKVIIIAKDNPLIQYYESKSQEINSPYKLLFESNMFNYLGKDLALGDVNNDGQIDIVITTEDQIRILNYDHQEFKEIDSLKEEYKHTRYDDYQVLIGDTDNNNSNEIIVENSNNLVKFERQKTKYIRTILPQFNRNRPKKIINFQDRNYLITRDYQNSIKFNFWSKKNYKIDRRLAVQNNEGYRLQISDVDDDQQRELIITAYNGNKKYTIKIYTLKGKLKYKFAKQYSPQLVVVDLDQDGTNEILLHSNDKKQGNIFAFGWDKITYALEWKINLTGKKVIDLASGDIDNDNQQELIVLAVENGKSKIYAYQVKYNKNN